MTDEQFSRFCVMMNDGMEPRLAEMLALQKFPGIKGSNSSFMAGTHFQDTQIDHYRYAAAQAQGVDTNGKRYISGLARYPNDPEAWVASLDDVATVVRARGWNCSGAFDHVGFEPKEHEEPPDTPIAGDIIRDRLEREQELAGIPDQDGRALADLQQKVVQELTGQVANSVQRVSDYDDPFSLPGMEPEGDD